MHYTTVHSFPFRLCLTKGALCSLIAVSYRSPLASEPVLSSSPVVLFTGDLKAADAAGQLVIS